jgi:Ca2+-binding EF-hand superfamily protein
MHIGDKVVSKKYVSLSVATLLAGALLQPVFAEEAKGDFKALDADANGAISAEEAQTNEALAASWETIDVNKDGQIDEAEFSAMEIEAPTSE